MTLRLAEGMEIQCPHCGAWHRLTQGAETTFLYYACGLRPEPFLVGLVGEEARVPARRTVSVSEAFGLKAEEEFQLGGSEP